MDRLAALMLAVAALAACESPANQFLCESNAQCVLGAQQGVCESSGSCSFLDTSCSSGRRYGERSGSRSGACVEAPQSVDSGIAPSIDASPDATVDAAVDAGVDVAITCVGNWTITPDPLGTGSVMRARYSDNTAWVYVGFDFSGPGSHENNAAVADSVPGLFSWYTDFTVDTPGVWTVTFTRDMGVQGASCMFVVDDTGEPPPLP
jgi:hypothetical protein